MFFNLFNKKDSLYDTFKKQSYLKGGLELSMQYLNEICKDKPIQCIKYKKKFFYVYKDIIPSAVVAIGEEIIEQEPDPEFKKVLAVRYKRIGNIVRFKELLVEATGREYLIRNIRKQEIESVLLNLSKPELELRIKEILDDFRDDKEKIYEIVFSILKDKYPELAVVYGMKYFDLNPFNIKFINVLEKRLSILQQEESLLRLEVNRKYLNAYKKIKNGNFFNNVLFESSQYKNQLKFVSNKFPQAYIERYIEDLVKKFPDNTTEIYKSAISILRENHMELSVVFGKKYIAINKYDLKIHQVLKSMINKVNFLKFTSQTTSKTKLSVNDMRNDIKNIIDTFNVEILEDFLEGIIEQFPDDKYKIYEIIFTMLKDSHTTLAVEYGKLYFESYPEKIKFIKVLVKRLERLNDESAVSIAKNALVHNDDTELEFFVFRYELNVDLQKCEELYDNDKSHLEDYIKKLEFKYSDKISYVHRSLHKFFSDKNYNKAEYYAFESLKIKTNEYLLKDMYDFYIKYGSISKALAVIPQDVKMPTLHTKKANAQSFLDLYENGFDLEIIDNSKDYIPIKNKVFYVLHNRLPYNSGGYATRSHGLLTGVANFGWEMNAVSRLGYPWDKMPDKKSEKRNYIDGITYHRLYKEGIGLGKLPLKQYLEEYAMELLAFAKKEKPEIIHAASNYMNGVVGSYVAKCLGIKFVYEVRGLWEITRISRQPEWKDTEYYNLMVKMEAEAAKSADTVLTLTQALKNEMISRGVPSDKIDLLPNGVTSKRFVPRGRNKALEKNLNLKGKIVIGYIGSVVAYEGLEILVKSVSFLIDRKIDNICVLVVGDGAVLEMIQNNVKEYNLEKYFIFTGRIPHEDVEEYYSLVDITPFPRKGQPVCEMVSPLKPFEAMAMEKAVISSNVDALAEIVTDGYNGLLFEKDNAEDLALKLERLINDKKLRLKLGKQARKWVLEYRDWKVISKTLSDVYNKIGNENKLKK